MSGVELNPTAVAAARAAGFTIFAEDLGAVAALHALQFDAACAFQVLEHVPEPLPFLRGMVDVVRPGGKIILSVPDAAFMRRINPGRVELLDQPPHHMTHWDAGVFHALEKLLPVRVSSVRHEPLQPYHVDWFVNSMARRAHTTLGPNLSRAVANGRAVAAMSRILKMGLRRFVNGHTLLVVFHKL
jgi:SAM-dependent methyltransferase